MNTLSVNRDERPKSMIDLAATLLPHGNPAFALWVKIDGKQPALAGRAPLSSHMDPGPPPKPAFTPAPAAPAAPTRPAPSAPRAEPDAAPRTKQAWPPPAAEAAEEGRRDTPTEMYVKGVHGSPVVTDEEAPEGPTSGDRDTPTRAYNVDQPAPQRPQFLETLKSPVGAGVGPYPGDAPPARDPRLDESDPATFNILDGDKTLGMPAADPSQIVLPMGASPKTTIPLGSVFRGMLPPIAQQTAPMPPPSTPQKPGWQASFDRALVWVGRKSEDLVRRYRELPQNTQIIVIIVAGTVAILILIFILFLITH
jgi:hypothetical protein